MDDRYLVLGVGVFRMDDRVDLRRLLDLLREKHSVWRQPVRCGWRALTPVERDGLEFQLDYALHVLPEPPGTSP